MVEIPATVADTPLPAHGEIAENPRPIPKLKRIIDNAAAAVPPAAIAAHETPDTSVSLVSDGPKCADLVTTADGECIEAPRKRPTDAKASTVPRCVVPINLVRFQANQALTLTVGNWPHPVLMLDGAHKLLFQESAFSDVGTWPNSCSLGGG